MGLEVATYINQLVVTNPLGTDDRSQGDDHIRLIKSALKNTFPNVDGPVTVTDEQLNSIAGDGKLNMPGMIVMWSGTIASIPAGWKLCNGSGTISNGNPVPNLVERFIIGTATDSGGTVNIGNTGGSKDAIVVAHTHTAASVVTDPGHTHQGATNAGGGVAFGFDGYDFNNLQSFSTTGISVATTVNSTGVSGTNANLPPYFALAFIIKD